MGQLRTRMQLRGESQQILREQQAIEQLRNGFVPYPPRNAPTGFFTGGTTTSCSRRLEVWKLRIGV